jgi:FkbM family methyltransferase
MPTLRAAIVALLAGPLVAYAIVRVLPMGGPDAARRRPVDAAPIRAARAGASSVRKSWLTRKLLLTPAILYFFVTDLPRIRSFGNLVFHFFLIYKWLMSGRHRAEPIDADVLGFTMRLDPADVVDAFLLAFPKYYESREIAFVRDHLRPGDVFVDLGAHVGFYSLVAARAVGPSGKVLAVEANPVTYERFACNVALNGLQQVTALNVGVADRSTTLSLAVWPQPIASASSFLGPGAGRVEVASEPLLELVRRHGITRITGMKLDIEGFEYRVMARFLADAGPTLMPEFIICEFFNEKVKAAGGNSLELLRSHGYRVRGRNSRNFILVLRHTQNEG